MSKEPDADWTQQFSVSVHIVEIERAAERESREQRFLVDRARNETALRTALKALFGAEDFPADYTDAEVLWRHDSLGKPFVEWRGRVAGWAENSGRNETHFHVSNTHDGAAHLVLAAYGENLAGVGVDVVHLPRLQRADKGRDYLLRFAAQFMAEEERSFFLEQAEHDSDDALVIRVAAHFSLMESASKACGTGLKIGGGMGKLTSLPKQSLGVRQLTPQVELIFSEESRNQLKTMGVVRYEAAWTSDADTLVSAVLLWKE